MLFFFVIAYLCFSTLFLPPNSHGGGLLENSDSLVAGLWAGAESAVTKLDLGTSELCS